MDFSNIDISTILGVISGLFGGTSLISFILYRKTEKRMKNAELKTKEVEAESAKFLMYEERLNHANETLVKQSETISTLNSALDDKTSRIRQISDELYASEKRTNDLNDKLVEATETIGKLNLQVDKLKRWKCHKSTCEIREPESPTIKGKTFEEDNA